jgi:hypothetical protein
LIESIVAPTAGYIPCKKVAFETVEPLAGTDGLHPSRSSGTSAGFSFSGGRQPKALALAQIPKLLPLSWTEHRPLLN